MAAFFVKWLIPELMKSRANSTLPAINAISVTDIYYPYVFDDQLGRLERLGATVRYIN
jgi:hypothetical protein